MILNGWFVCIVVLQCRYLGPSFAEELGFAPSREGLRLSVPLPLQLTLQSRYVRDDLILRPILLPRKLSAVGT